MCTTTLSTERISGRGTKANSRKLRGRSVFEKDKAEHEQKKSSLVMRTRSHIDNIKKSYPTADETQARKIKINRVFLKKSEYYFSRSLF